MNQIYNNCSQLLYHDTVILSIAQIEQFYKINLNNRTYLTLSPAHSHRPPTCKNNKFFQHKLCTLNSESYCTLRLKPKNPYTLHTLTAKPVLTLHLNRRNPYAFHTLTAKPVRTSHLNRRNPYAFYALTAKPVRILRLNRQTRTDFAP